MNKLNSMIAIAFLAVTFTACKKEADEPIFIVPPSDGNTLTLNGLVGAEDGTAAGNSVYVDFSADKQTSVERDSWDLGFYSGSDFRVILNSTNGASALLVNKTDLNAVTATDFDPNELKVGQGLGNFTIVDDGRESNILNKTAIAVVSVTDADNKVYIINRKGGAGTTLTTNDLYKIRVLRKGTGYTLQYAKVAETTFKSLDINKNAEVNYQFASLIKGAAITVEPAKGSWDIVWGYSMYFTAGSPYAFSDLVFINNLAGVAAAAVIATATKTYASFNESNISDLSFSSARDVIGSKWRTAPDRNGNGGRVNTDVFFIIKDATGNLYKLKFVSFISGDGGTRGKPIIEYKLIKKV
ncbi:hypothetical protein GJU39_07015 [Pedobacter petrophilus]|uniref:HmuY protein n=1 Tax=Pedobacter petrophilus TaxID=1908241 RepID=A0A7K0FWE1_9SPHI|nr:HmuY family protein [Pedobacter petrophilus]MRX75835.1 hypothetical protein [Pedobacter petrophilus]